MKRALACMLSLVLLGAPQAGEAKKKTLKLLKVGLKCYAELNYGCAIAKLEAASQRMDAKSLVLEPAQALKLLETLAFAQASVERHAQAVASFARCLKLKPTYKLDPKVISPKIYGDYHKARRAMLDQVTDRQLQQPSLPELYPVSPPRAGDYRVHTPDFLTLTGMHEERTLLHDFDFLVGATLLFGGDGEDFHTGFSAAIQYLYAVHRLVEIQVLVQFSTHNYAGVDAKPGFPATLYTLHPGIGARLRFDIGDYVVISAGVLGGASLSGLGSLTSRKGGFVAGTASVTVRPVPEFGVGLTAVPTLVLAELSDGETGKSFILPLFLRLAAYF